MNDASTNQPQTADGGQTTAGRGRHRGPVSQQDSMVAPRGRHRRPAEENEQSGQAA
ncbi:hypothetical protein ACFWOL_07455 [Streptomyces sp. NPDC058442]|uniref:hypothetical protein n=1 Tax=Streptomyces sp. NPDC058442 TaxID=3346503 RepID=UPI003665F10C